MKEPKPITYAELMAEVDNIKGKSEIYRITLTLPQKKFIEKCRSKLPPLSWEQIRDLWNKMPDWQHYSSGESLRKRYNKSLTGN